MKKQIRQTLALMSMLLIVGAFQISSAQSAGRIIVDVPFDFVAGDELLRAGRYFINPATRDSAKLLMIQSEDKRVSALVSTSAINVDKKIAGARLAFKQYGERYFLTEVWTPGVSGGRALRVSNEERKLRRDLARSGDGANGESARAETVIVTCGEN